jgi:hypothetical protein
MIQVCQLFVSPGHNFFGHHGQPAGQNPVVEVEQAECVAGRGIRGDRFFDFKEGYKGQITFFARADLNSLVGAQFEIQGVRFEGVEQCKPCHWMNSVLGPGAEDWLQGRGGLRARILTDGVLQREA